MTEGIIEISKSHFILREMVEKVNEFVQICQNTQMLCQLRDLCLTSDDLKNFNLGNIASAYIEIVVKNANDLFNSGNTFQILDSQYFIEAYRSFNKAILRTFVRILTKIIRYDISVLEKVSNDRTNIIIVPCALVEQYKELARKTLPNY